MKIVLLFVCFFVIYHYGIIEGHRTNVAFRESEPKLLGKNMSSTIKKAHVSKQKIRKATKKKTPSPEVYTRRSLGSVSGVDDSETEPWKDSKSERGHLNVMRDSVMDVYEGVSDIIGSLSTGGLDTEKEILKKFLKGSKKKGDESAKSIISGISTIFPGTLWCGGGNISSNNKDLGAFYATDYCCREHDMCPESIPAGETKYGLINKGLFTRSHCDCDSKFNQCLAKACTPICFAIGTTYFNILGPQCYKQDYPITGCKKWVTSTSNLKKCVDYEVDTSAAPVWQWRDNPLFYCAEPNITEIMSRKNS